MVHFQNLGTYFAQNIVVVDTLDSDLDWQSLRPVYSSHKPASIEISEQGVLKYTFKNINLPAEMQDAINSNGMFTCTIKTKKKTCVTCPSALSSGTLQPFTSTITNR